MTGIFQVKPVGVQFLNGSFLSLIAHHFANLTALPPKIGSSRNSFNEFAIAPSAHLD